VLLQERIEGPDVRVHVVGQQVFSEMIEFDGVDYRSQRSARHQSTSLPPALAAACVDLAQKTGLTLAGIDFKISSQSEAWYFLEINSMPCYQGYDKRAGGRIGDAIADWLK
jgi:glutathione synthase/RimK-type ligase-like ATP-grasp enzyme